MSLDIQLKNGVILAFPTPMLRYLLPEADEINPPLRDAILERAQGTPGVTRHNVGGWRSPDDLLSWPLPEMNTVRGAINRSVAQLTQLTMGQSGKAVKGEVNAVAWASVLREGDYLRPHMHPLSTWSGVYFVACESESEDHPDSGVVEFLDPRMAANQLQTPGNPFGEPLRIRPAPGLIIVHPGWLTHFVNPHYGASERVAIGFNVFVKGAKLTESKPEA